MKDPYLNGIRRQVVKEPDLLLETTVEEVRSWLNGDGPLIDKLAELLDEAQGRIHSGLDEVQTTLLITVKK